MSYGLVFKNDDNVVYLGKYSVLGIIDYFEPIDDPTDIFSSLTNQQFVFVHAIDLIDRFSLCDIYTLNMSVPITDLIGTTDFILMAITLYGESLDYLNKDDIFFDNE